MNHSKLQDMKRNHLYMILNELYLNDNATINELIEKTDLSQPSIRNMLRSLQKQNIIHEIGCDFSTGGRCPTRFALNIDKFHLLCIFIQNHIAHVHIIYHKQEQAHFHIDYQVEEDLIKQIQHIIQQYSIHCCVLSVEGIVQDLTYITDHFNSLEKHSWVQSLKNSIDIPVCLQNDVKAMHYGQYLNHPVTPSFYLHINELGIGGSYMAHNELLNGQNGISGEIGLIPYNGKPLNLAIRECRHQEQFNELLRFLLTIIISTYDPAFIHISIDNQWNTESLTLKDYLLHLFPLKIENQIIYHQEFMNLMFDGLQYIGIQCLLNKIIQGEEKMKKYKAIIYDIDGTVLNTLNMNMYPLIQIIKEETGEEWTFEQVLKFAAYPGMKVMQELGVKNQEKTYARWVKYVNEYEEGATLYDGFMEVFKAFQDNHIIQAVVSAKTAKQYEIDFVDKGLDKFMDVAILADDTTKHKPDPEPLLECIKRLNIEVSEAIYIGDALSDYQASRNAGMDFGYAKWGSVSSEGIDHPDLVFESPLDLLKLLEKNDE